MKALTVLNPWPWRFFAASSASKIGLGGRTIRASRSFMPASGGAGGGRTPRRLLCEGLEFLAKLLVN